MCLLSLHNLMVKEVVGLDFTSTLPSWPCSITSGLVPSAKLVRSPVLLGCVGMGNRLSLASRMLPHPTLVTTESTPANSHRVWHCFPLISTHPSWPCSFSSGLEPAEMSTRCHDVVVMWDDMGSRMSLAIKMQSHVKHIGTESTMAVGHSGWPCFHLQPPIQVGHAPSPWV